MKLLYGDVIWNLIWIVPVVLAAAAFAAAKRKKITALLFNAVSDAQKYTTLSAGRRTLRNVFLSLAILCAVIAAAGLSWGRQILPDAGPGHDLLILFDVSKSMLSDDVKPSRLDQGKWLVRELVRKNPGDRFGLIAFAGTSFLQCPLTSDMTSFLQLTDALDTESIPLGGTNIQSALENAVKAFEGAEGNHKAVILITDGDELTGRASAVVTQLTESGIPLFIAGIGDPGNPSVIHIPDGEGGKKILTDAEGNAVKSPLNEAQLAELAKKTSGIYVRSTVTNPGLDELESGIRKLGRNENRKSLSGFRPIERPVYPFALALLFLFLYLLTSETKRKSALILTAFLLIPATCGAEEVKISAAQHFNAGLEYQKNNDIEKAQESYQQAISAENDPRARMDSFCNLGTIAHQEARAKMVSAQDILKQQNPDGAEKELNAAVAAMEKAEAMYRENFRYAARLRQPGAVRNQQLLLEERQGAEELKKEIEKLRKLQEEARKETEKAQQQQQQQQQKDNPEQQKQNQEQTAQAQQKAKDLKEQAEKLNQKDLQQKASEAEEELKKAQENQKQGKDKEAEENLKKAMEALSGNGEQKKDSQEPQQGEQNGGEPPPAPEKPQGQARQAQEAPGEMDKKQAEAILEAMSQNEKELRDMIKEQQKRSQPSRKPVKDW